MIGKYIAIAMLLSSASISQIKTSSRIIFGKDTITVKQGQSIPNIIDSLKKARFNAYQAERQRVQDSIDMAEAARIKKGPHLYFSAKEEETGNFYIETEYDPDVAANIIEETKFEKIDSVMTYSDMCHEVLNEINSKRTQKLAIDTLRQEMFSEDMILSYYIRKGCAVLQKDIYEKCPSECYKEVFWRISRKKRLMKNLLSENMEYIKLAIIEDRRNVTAFICYKKKNRKKDSYKIVFIR